MGHAASLDLYRINFNQLRKPSSEAILNVAHEAISWLVKQKKSFLVPPLNRASCVSYVGTETDAVWQPQHLLGWDWGR